MTELLKRLLRHPQGAIGLGLATILLLAIVLGPWIAPYDPEEFHFLARLAPSARTSCRASS